MQTRASRSAEGETRKHSSLQNAGMPNPTSVQEGTAICNVESASALSIIQTTLSTATRGGQVNMQALLTWQVLLVEDNPGDVDLIRMCAERFGGVVVHHVPN